MLRFVIPTCAIVVVLASTRPARASACSGIHAGAEDQQITIDPLTECLRVTVEADGCGDGLQVVLENGCSAPLEVPDDFVCDKGPEVSCSPALPGERVRMFPVADADGNVDETFVVELEEQVIEIHVGYREVTSGGLGNDDMSSSGGPLACAASPVGTSRGSWIAGFAALASLLAALGRGTRRR